MYWQCKKLTSTSITYDKNDKMYIKNKRPFAFIFFGIVLILAGSFFIYDIFTENQTPQIIILFPSIIIIVGIYIIFSCNGLILNKKDGLIIGWQGFIFPIFKKRYTIMSFKEVYFNEEIRKTNGGPNGGGRRTFKAYTVTLMPDIINITITETTDRFEAR